MQTIRRSKISLWVTIRKTMFGKYQTSMVRIDGGEKKIGHVHSSYLIAERFAYQYGKTLRFELVKVFDFTGEGKCNF